MISSLTSSLSNALLPPGAALGWSAFFATCLSISDAPLFSLNSSSIACVRWLSSLFFMLSSYASRISVVARATFLAFFPVWNFRLTPKVSNPGMWGEDREKEREREIERVTEWRKWERKRVEEIRIRERKNYAIQYYTVLYCVIL